MSDVKTCSLTANEVEQLILWYGCNLNEYTAEKIERINYLYKRLKSFYEVEIVKEVQPVAQTGW